MMAPIRALPHFGFCFNLGDEISIGNGNWSFSFLAAPECFPEQVHNPPAGFFKVEQQADERCNNGLPEQCAQTRIYVGQHHKSEAKMAFHVKSLLEWSQQQLLVISI
jgi:hypothetical protein